MVFTNHPLEQEGPKLMPPSTEMSPDEHLWTDWLPLACNFYTFLRSYYSPVEPKSKYELFWPWILPSNLVFVILLLLILP